MQTIFLIRSIIGKICTLAFVGALTLVYSKGFIVHINYSVTYEQYHISLGDGCGGLRWSFRWRPPRTYYTKI